MWAMTMGCLGKSLVPFKGSFKRGSGLISARLRADNHKNYMAVSTDCGCPPMKDPMISEFSSPYTKYLDDSRICYIPFM